MEELSKTQSNTQNKTKHKMSITTIILLVLVGIIAGVLSSMVGIGGGIVIVPCLVFIFGFSQKMAQGTSLAMLLPPIGILGVYLYHKEGNVSWPFALVLILSFVVGLAAWCQMAAKLKHHYGEAHLCHFYDCGIYQVFVF